MTTLRAQSKQPVDLLAAMQFLALEIAGRSMFSMEMREYGPEMRALLMRFAERHAHPYLLDLLLPSSIPAPRDFARRRFQAQWMQFVERIMRGAPARAASGCAPRPVRPADRRARSGNRRGVHA